MSFDVVLLFAVLILFIWADLILVVLTLTNKARWLLKQERQSRELASLVRIFERGKVKKTAQVRRLFINYAKLHDSIGLPPEMKASILEMARSREIEPLFVRRMKSRSSIRRMEAAAALSVLGTPSARREIERALAAEKHYPTKLYFANALIDIGDRRSVPVLVSSLLGSHRWYRDKVNMLLSCFGEDIREYLPKLFIRDEVELRELLVDLSGTMVSGELKDYCITLIDDREIEAARLDASVKGAPRRSCAHCSYGRTILENNRRDCPFHGVMDASDVCRRYSVLPVSINPGNNHKKLAVRAAEALEKHHFKTLEDERFLYSKDPELQVVAISAQGKGMDAQNVITLVSFLDSAETAPTAKIALGKLLERHPRLTPVLVDQFTGATGYRRERIAEVMAGRIEYFIARLDGKDAQRSVSVIREIIQLGRVNELIEFLRRNENMELEDALVAIIRDTIAGNESMEREFGIYLPDRILDKCGLSRVLLPVKKREEKRDMGMVTTMYVVLAMAILFFPVLYVIRHADYVFNVPILHQVKTFVVEFNYDFAWYSMAVNVVYGLLLLLSRMKVGKLERLWNLKRKSMLFRPRMLPSISIIAPAFNEEKTILESANSLLNLKYPDYELVIVNDGSRDSTLATLIKYFSLQRVDFPFTQKLKHHPVRGVYMNPLMPKLIIVDKENGGKADSINAGINIARNEYICGIDADSLLEGDSLLKIASLTLDDGIETPAIGGNVFPINGCTVERGMLTDITIPKNGLARLQTIEYMRAFMCGRLGWAQLNSLLIISGAFGLFRKERVISIGGYLTSSEMYQRDTVGEDMELVVRIGRYMRENKLKYRIGYSFNANCWTEVPEDIKSLKRQRDRWHRGLIDILYFHRRTLFNPKYGRMGLLGMPYYFIFEMVGPLFEIQGYIMVFIAALFGLLSTKLALLLFIATIMFGIFISMASVLIAERNIVYFSYRDSIKLLVTALAESFGPREFFSLWRVLGFFNAMKRPVGWGKAERKGFGSGSVNVGEVKGSRPAG